MKLVLVAAEKECTRCREARAVLARLAERFPDLEIALLKVTDPEAAQYGIVMSPTVILDNTILASGRAPNEKKLIAFLEARRGAG